MVPKADPLTQAEDVATALAFAQSRAASWGGDPARFVLMGHSAGAHLIALLAACPPMAYAKGARPWLGAIPLDSAAYDITPIMQARHMPFYDRAFGSDPAYWRQASPIDRITGTPAPMLLVCSSLRINSCPNASAFASRLLAAGTRATVQPESLTHAQINKTLGQPGAYTEAVEGFLESIGLP